MGDPGAEALNGWGIKLLEAFNARNEVQLVKIDVARDVVVELSDRRWKVVFFVFEANVAVMRTLPGLELLFGSPYCRSGRQRIVTEK